MRTRRFTTDTIGVVVIIYLSAAMGHISPSQALLISVTMYCPLMHDSSCIVSLLLMVQFCMVVKIYLYGTSVKRS